MTPECFQQQRISGSQPQLHVRGLTASHITVTQWSRLVGSMNSLVPGIVGMGYLGWAMVAVGIDHGGGMIVANLLSAR